MLTIFRELRYVVRIRQEEHVLRVQELVSGTENWPEKFRVQVHASLRYPGRTIYGASDHEVAAKVAEYLDLSIKET
jgi:hypothetical protein